jgi:hypothetical protein
LPIQYNYQFSKSTLPNFQSPNCYLAILPSQLNLSIFQVQVAQLPIKLFTTLPDLLLNFENIPSYNSRSMYVLLMWVLVHPRPNPTREPK